MTQTVSGASQKPQGLMIVHVDGLGYHYLQQALAQGRMPYVQHLLAREGYTLQRWRSGLPSTTPYVQAGLMFGDNAEIPSFRWWDKDANRLIVFGGLPTFKHVREKYFQGAEPLLRAGAAIATCYTAEAVETYGVGYRARYADGGDTLKDAAQHYSMRHIASAWVMNPGHLWDLLRTTAVQISSATIKYWRARLRSQPAAKTYVVANVLEEIFLQQMTRYAALRAMRENYPIIYAAFYSYDGIAHAFGPESEYSYRSLRHIDHIIQRIGESRHKFAQRDYELLILSDHGQTETMPYAAEYGRTLGQLMAEWLPTFAIDEYNGQKIAPPTEPQGHVVLAYSGGLTHLYFIDKPTRLTRAAIEQYVPGLIDQLARAPGVGFVMLRDDQQGWLITANETLRLEAAPHLSAELRQFLAQYGEPEITAKQLHKLNSFERSGDLIIFGAYDGRQQINFETQIGGHGAMGGEQMYPFILVKPAWGFDTSQVSDACELYPQLRRLRDRLTE